MIKRFVVALHIVTYISMAFADQITFGCSGLARTLRASAFTRPTTARRAFKPIQNNFSPALGARFASDVRDGKIHQVIGAVVDGTANIPQLESLHPSLELCMLFCAQSS